MTGVSSPLGQELVLQLKELEYYVIGIGRKKLVNGIIDEYLIHDLISPLNNFECKFPIEIVYHLASAPGSRSNIKSNPISILSSSVIDFNIFDFIRKHRVQNFVYASSATASDYQFEAGGNSEPDTIFGWQKRLSEKVLFELYASLNINISIGRLFTLYGSTYATNGLVGAWVEAAKNGKSIEVWDETMRRTLIHVKDAATALILLSQESSGFVLADICSDDIFELGEIVRVLEKFLCPSGTLDSSYCQRRSNVNVPDQIGDTSIIKSLGWKQSLTFIDYITALGSSQ